jgi:hypothetical protein
MPPQTRSSQQRTFANNKNTVVVKLGKTSPSLLKVKNKIAALRRAPKAPATATTDTAAAAANESVDPMAHSVSTYCITAHALDKPEQMRRFEFRVLFASAAARTHANRDQDEAFLEPMAAAIDAAFPDLYDVQEESITEVSHHDAMDADTRIHMIIDAKHQVVDVLRMSKDKDAPVAAATTWDQRDAASAFAPDEALDADRPVKITDDATSSSVEAAIAPAVATESRAEEDDDAESTLNSDEDDEDYGDSEDQAMDEAEEEHVPSDDEDED